MFSLRKNKESTNFLKYAEKLSFALEFEFFSWVLSFFPLEFFSRWPNCKPDLVPPPPPLPYFPLNPKPVSNCCVFSSVENNPRQAKPGFSRSEPCFQLKVGCPILKKYSLACNPRHCKLFENCALVNHSMISTSVHTHRSRWNWEQ